MIKFGKFAWAIWFYSLSVDSFSSQILLVLRDFSFSTSSFFALLFQTASHNMFFLLALPCYVFSLLSFSFLVLFQTRLILFPADFATLSFQLDLQLDYYQHIDPKIANRIFFCLVSEIDIHWNIHKLGLGEDFFFQITRFFIFTFPEIFLAWSYLVPFFFF